MFELTFLTAGPTSQTVVVALYYAVFAAGVRPAQSIDAMALVYIVTTLIWLLIALQFVNPHRSRRARSDDYRKRGRLRRRVKYPPPIYALDNVEKIEENDHGNGNAEDPQKNAAHVQLRAFNAKESGGDTWRYDGRRNHELVGVIVSAGRRQRKMAQEFGNHSPVPIASRTGCVRSRRAGHEGQCHK
jgi:hypothetical protein